ncbi:YidC/Oxa1 family membrane protein insertase [Marinobacter segnicrescens]|uniref:Membrane protein insertase YidC n=1 Tax=Marinobacter segnicrescens TaxID=430453 RepID=A0A1I0DK70_9GAMM|nr:membrane protein insertase YidC [Marinobacter segnicrescens]SET32736.1 YidC/Oxa1 family membrane protein insertase [Marinobacter segnicrescens]
MDIQRIVLFAGLAIVSYLMVLAWNEDYNQPAEPVAVEEQTANLRDAATDDEMSLPDSSGSTDSATVDEFSAPGDATTATPSDLSASDRVVTVRTDVLELKIDRIGGNLVEASLLDYDRTLDSAEPLRVLQTSDNRTYFLESGMIGQNGFDSRRNGEPPVYQVDNREITLEDGQDSLQVDLRYQTEQGIAVIKRYSLSRNSYEIDVEYLIDNRSEQPWQGNFTGKIVRDEAPDPTAQNSMGIRAFLGLVISSPEDPYEKFDFSDLEDDRINQPVTNGWLAFLQHYFISAWIPPRDQTHQFQTTRRGNLNVMGFVSPATVIEPGETGRAGARIYVGPKIIERLEGVAPNLDRTVDFGFLFFISLPLFIFMDWIHSLVGNWGVSIILLTVVVKAVFFKLSATSYRSMARMRAVAPQLTRLRELYGDDRQRMSQEMMALYKKEKINPLGGCLPILVQMPVFIALYWVLFESVQLRHAPFMLWIQDLSQMDPYFILPILMGASMMLQMHLNPTPPDPMQAKIMKLMPIIFTVFFLWFPAGLVLYWLTNNILSIAQQWYITRKIESEMATRKA